MTKNIDKITHQKIVRSLEKLGLSEKEARVYLALLPRGGVGSSKLVRATGLHGQFVYNALARLEDLGLVRYSLLRGRKKFSANPPARLRFLVEEKRLLAESLAESLAKTFSSAPEQVVELYEGRDAFIAHHYELLEDVAVDGSFIDVIGGGGEALWGVFGSELRKFDAKRSERGISVRYLGSDKQRGLFEQEVPRFGKFEFRSLPGLSSGAVDTQIRPSSVTFAVYGEPVMLITIKNSSVAARQREFFETLWKSAKPGAATVGSELQ